MVRQETNTIKKGIIEILYSVLEVNHLSEKLHASSEISFSNDGWIAARKGG